MIGVLSNTGTFAADTILASQWGHFLWGNVITVAYGIAFCIYLKHPVMIPEITFMALWYATRAQTSRPKLDLRRDS